MNTLAPAFAFAIVELMIAKRTKIQKIVPTPFARPSHGAPLFDAAKSLNFSGPKATVAAYVVNAYKAPIEIVAYMTALGIFLRGFSVSSASGAAASNPENARRQKTEPAMTPDQPAKPGAFA